MKAAFNPRVVTLDNIDLSSDRHYPLNHYLDPKTDKELGWSFWDAQLEMWKSIQKDGDTRHFQLDNAARFACSMEVIDE